MKKTFPVYVYFILSFAFGLNSLLSQSIKSQGDILIDLKKLADSSFVSNFNGNYKKAIKINLKLLELAKKANNPYYLHRGYSSLGYNYLIQKDTIGAQESFAKSKKYASLSGNDVAIARTYVDLANFYKEKDEFSKQNYVNYNEAIKIFEKAKDSKSLASTHYYSIKSLMRDKNYDKAYIHIKEIQKYINNIEDDNFCDISVHSQMADYYTYKKNYDLADKYYALVIKNSIIKEYWQELENTYDKYSKNLFEQGRYDEAYEAKNGYIKYFKINEELRRSSENKALIGKFELETYKKEAEKEKEYLNKIAKSKSNNNTWLSILSVALIAIFIYLLVNIDKKKNLVNRLKNKNAKYLEAQKKAENLSNAKNKFLSTVSHELRTPLYGVIGLASILSEDETLVHQKENLDSLKYSADYLMALINDVLQMNKIDAIKSDEEKKPFCIRKLLDAIVSSFEYNRNQNNNNIHLDIHPDTPDIIAANDLELSQILMNLIGNAHKFTNNGDIYVTLEPLNKSFNKLDIQFTVKDTGIGIAKNKQQLIFDEFLQVSGDKKTDRQGSGLGLAIVMKILKKNDRKIELESTLGKGSTFSFVLPFDLVKQKVDGGYKASITFGDTTLLKDKHILIVDDNAINRIVTQKILQKKGVICNQAKDGKEAVDLVEKTYYDLVLMDVNMPVMNGLRATKIIRKSNSYLPIVALTAVVVDEMRDEILKSGMNEIVLKPYNLEDFYKTLITCISGKEKHTECEDEYL